LKDLTAADGDLIASLRRGETGAWAELCDRYGGALYRYAFHLAGGEASWAEDIRQETLLAAADAVRSFRGEAPLFGWLCAIARRKAADELRRRGRMADPLPDGDEPPGVWERMEYEPLPEDVLQHSELRAGIVRALWNLPAEYREALTARYAEGTDVAALARRIGRSYKATESMLSRARAALRDQLSEADHD
jgi:RNA polymerase sigma-70 factor (ECF subfamily)